MLEPEHIIRLEDGTPARVVLLDQRRLPDEVVELECSSAAEVADAIRVMAVRGAPAIGVAGAYGLVLASALRHARAHALQRGRARDRRLRLRGRRALRRVGTRPPRARARR